MTNSSSDSDFVAETERAITVVNTEEPVLRKGIGKEGPKDDGKKKSVASKKKTDASKKKPAVSKKKPASSKKEPAAKVTSKKEPKKKTKKAKSDEEDEEEIEEGAGKGKGKFREIDFACNPKKLVAMISELSEKQRELVKEMGFGAVFLIQDMYVPYTLAVELLNRFDHKQLMQYINDGLDRFVLTTYDSFDVFMLPYGPRPINLLSQRGFPKKDNEEKEKDLEVRAKWRNILTFTSSNEIALSDILKRIQDDDMKDEPGDLFKQLFVLYAFGVFFDPKGCKKADQRLLRFIDDAEAIPDYNWSDLVLNSFEEAITRIKKSKDSKNCGGCIMLLVICYLHRYMYRGHKEPRKLPLVQHWNRARLNERVVGMGEEVWFGNAFLDNTYPISNEDTVVKATEPSTAKLMKKPESPAKLTKNPESPVKLSNQTQTGCDIISFKIPRGILTDAEIDEQYDPGEDKLLAILKRNVEVITNEYVHSLMNMRKQQKHDEDIIKLATQQGTSSQNPDGSEPPELSPHPSDEWFQNPKVWEIVDKITEDFIKRTKVDLTQDGGPSFDLGSELPPHFDVAEKGKLSCTLDDLGPKGVEVKYASVFMNKYKRDVMDLEELKKRVVDYCLFHDPENERELLVSYTHVYTIPREECSSFNASQFLFSSIVDCWALLLNYVEQKTRGTCDKFCFGTNLSLHWIQATVGTEAALHADKNPDVVRSAIEKCYVASENESKLMQGGMKEWFKDQIRSQDTNLSDLNLLIFPLHFKNHYSLYCINMLKKKIQYIDNLTFEVNEVKAFFEPLVIETSKVLEELCQHPKAKEIVDYGFESIPLKMKDISGYDCGIFAMKSMEIFRGEPFKCSNLEAVGSRRLLRADICATLALADINECRIELLKKVEDFEKDKDTAIKRVKEFEAAKKKAEQDKKKEEMAKKKEENKKKKQEEEKKKKEEKAASKEKDQAEEDNNEDPKKKKQVEAAKKKKETVDKKKQEAAAEAKDKEEIGDKKRKKKDGDGKEKETKKTKKNP